MSRGRISLAARVICALIPIASVAHAGDTAKIEAGEAIYGNYCAACHGEELRNTSGGVTFDLRRLRSEDRERFFTVVLDGKKQMPPWRGVLQMNQIEAIWAYVRATVDR